MDSWDGDDTSDAASSIDTPDLDSDDDSIDRTLCAFDTSVILILNDEVKTQESTHSLLDVLMCNHRSMMCNLSKADLLFAGAAA